MALQHISVSIDPTLVAKGDVIIIKRTYFDPNRAEKLSTRCTKCGDSFKTELRRMERLDSNGKRRCEVRNVPQCVSCRSQKKAPAAITEPSRLLPVPAPEALPEGRVLRLAPKTRTFAVETGSLCALTKSWVAGDQKVYVKWLGAAAGRQNDGDYAREDFEIAPRFAKGQKVVVKSVGCPAEIAEDSSGGQVKVTWLCDHGVGQPYSTPDSDVVLQ